MIDFFLAPVLRIADTGGWVVVAIALVSLCAWTLVVFEYLRLRQRTGSEWRRTQRLVDSLQAGRSLKETLEVTPPHNFIGQLLNSPLLTSNFDRSSIEALIMPWFNQEVVRFDRSLRMIAVMAAVMPLLGLLGTVLGMIDTFQTLTRQGIADVNDLAHGISLALITTQAGLVISVPVLLAHGYLQSKVAHYLGTANVMLKKIETVMCPVDDAPA